MTDLLPSLEAHRYLRAAMKACSWQAGWRSLLLRAYEDPLETEEFTTPATADHLIVLVTKGTCEIEGRYRGKWNSAHYRRGSIGMTAPGEEVTLRWRGKTRQKTLQLHLHAAMIREAMAELSPRDPQSLEMPNKLHCADPAIQQTMLSLAEAMMLGAPDLYAETAAIFLSTHLLARHGHLGEARNIRGGERLRPAEIFMRENLSAPLSLADIAEQAGVSRFHLLRIFKAAYGETPLRYLTRIRMEEAQRRLRKSADSVTEIAFACGYENSAHFASAFRRVVGVSPSAYRRVSLS